MGSVTPGFVPGLDVGSIGLTKLGVVLVGAEVGSMGLTVSPSPEGAILVGIESKVGWNHRRVRIACLLRSGRFTT